MKNKFLIFDRFKYHIIQEMLTTAPKYITDDTGKRISVVLPIAEFQAIMEELEELEDIKLYDQAKEKDDGERIPFSEYLRKRKTKNV